MRSASRWVWWIHRICEVENWLTFDKAKNHGEVFKSPNGVFRIGLSLMGGAQL